MKERMNEMNPPINQLSPAERQELLNTLKSRFEKNMARHPGLDWAKVQAKLEANSEKLWSLSEWKAVLLPQLLLISTVTKQSAE